MPGKRSEKSNNATEEKLNENEDWLIYYNKPLDYEDSDDEVEYNDLWEIENDFYGYDSDNDESIPTDPEEFKFAVQSPSKDSDDDGENTGYNLATKYVIGTHFGSFG